MLPVLRGRRCGRVALRVASRVALRVALRVLAGVLLTGGSLGPSAVAAAPPAAPKPGEQLCRISDERLTEISGLVATDDGYVALPDGNPTNQQMLQVFDLDAECQVVERHSFERNPWDPEDLAMSQDGTLWIADIGDNDLERDTVALWEISPDRETAKIYRMTYPDGRHDAEALLMQPDGVPVIVTKDLDGTGIAGIYAPTKELQPEQTVPMKKLGEIKLAATGTGGGPLGAVGQKLVTGATLSVDGTRAVVRTYTDAYEWKVSGGDVAAALTKGEPVVTPLPQEPQGEAITLSRDGKRYITASEGGRGQPAQMYGYVPTRPEPPKEPAPKEDGTGWFDLGLQLRDVKMIIAAVGVIGLVMVVLGIWGIRRARRDPDGGGGGEGSPDDDPDSLNGSGRAAPPGRGRGPSRPRDSRQAADARGRAHPSDGVQRRDGRPAGDGFREPRWRGEAPATPGRVAGRASVGMPRGPATGVARPPVQARAAVPPSVPHPRAEPGRARRSVANRPDEPGADQPPGGRYW